MWAGREKGYGLVVSKSINITMKSLKEGDKNIWDEGGDSMRIINWIIKIPFPPKNKPEPPKEEIKTEPKEWKKIDSGAFGSGVIYGINKEEKKIADKHKLNAVQRRKLRDALDEMEEERGDHNG